MRLDDFRVMVDRLAREVPPEFRDGIVAIDVSAKVLPHPVHGDVYTLGECVPLEWSGSGADFHSRVLLYYGSVASPPPPRRFDWRGEAWGALTPEARHHLGWRGELGDLAPVGRGVQTKFA